MALTHPASAPRRSGAQVARFLVLGAANTVVSTAVFYALSFVVPATVAFTIVYLAALIYLTIATPRFVFGVRPRHTRTAALAAWYVVVYLVGLATIRLLGSLDLPREVLTLGTVAVTSPLSFIGARFIVTRL